MKIAVAAMEMCIRDRFVGPPELDAEWDDRGIDGVNSCLLYTS